LGGREPEGDDDAAALAFEALRKVAALCHGHQRLKCRDRQGLGFDDFTDADLAALEATRVPDDSKAFDNELPS
jgi:hypothetical protein